MRQHRDASRAVHELDRLARRERGVRLVARTTAPQVLHERLVGVAADAELDQRARDVRPADRAAGGDRLDARELDRDADLLQARDHARGAGAPRVTRDLEPRAQRGSSGEMPSPSTCSERAPSCSLTESSIPAITSMPSRFAFGLRLGDAVGRVVVGERERRDAVRRPRRARARRA